MPILLVLFGVVVAVATLLGIRSRPRPPVKPPVWQDPRAPADQLAAPRRSDHHPADHHTPGQHAPGHDGDDG